MIRHLAAVISGLLLAAGSAGVFAQSEKAEYERRVAMRLADLYKSLDRNGDGVVVREEARGDLVLGPLFDDIDINRDGTMTPEELSRYLEQRYGIAPGR